jgi:4-hydroxybenzoate polyprenyltransferase
MSRATQSRILMSRRSHAWLELARISNLPTVWTNVLAGWILAGGEWQWGPLAWLLAGGSLMYTAGMILNDAMDVKFDREHRSERPIPSGRVTLGTAWGVGAGMLLGGAVMCFLGAGACGWLVLALVAAIVAYDAFHKPWAGSVLIMGSCRTLLYLVAGSAVTGGLSWGGNHELVIKAVALGGYIVGVSLIARNESAKFNSLTGRAPLLQRVVGMAGLALPLVAGIWYAGWHQQWQPVVIAMAFGGVVLAAIFRMRENRDWIGGAVGMLLAAIPIADAVAVATRELAVSVAFVGIMPGLVAWQRKIAAT